MYLLIGAENLLDKYIGNIINQKSAKFFFKRYVFIYIFFQLYFRDSNTYVNFYK